MTHNGRGNFFLSAEDAITGQKQRIQIARAVKMLIQAHNSFSGPHSGISGEDTESILEVHAEYDPSKNTKPKGDHS
ncbi:hypothetical protein ACS0TY_008568 [Phlomoides rotata]